MNKKNSYTKKNKGKSNALSNVLVPPQNIEAEQSVLGAILLDAKSLIKIVDKLHPDDFYEPINSKIYESMLELFEKRRAIDVVTLTDLLETKKELKQIGGATYLANLVNMVPSSAHISHYADIIAQKAILRRLIEASSEISALAYGEKNDIDGVLDRSEQIFFQVSQKNTRQNFVPIREILSESFERMDELHNDKGAIKGIATGFSALDNLLAGLQPSDLIILAARPSMGKTSFALNIAENIAIKDKKAVAIFSLEQSKEQLADRMICSQAGIDAWKLRTGKLSEEDFPKIGYAMGVLSEASIYIDDQPFANVMEIRAKARRLQMENKLSLLIIDYLQLMQGSRASREPNRVQEISEISRSLKALARELNIPVIALSQLSRAVEHRPDKRPQLADLRESGSIEQDADVVMFIYRDEYYDPETEDKNIAEILVKKHRNGPVGNVKLYFYGERTQFRNLDKTYSAIDE
jgi:replicative DNA helicase